MCWHQVIPLVVMKSSHLVVLESSQGHLDNVVERNREIYLDHVKMLHLQSFLVGYLEMLEICSLIYDVPGGRP